MSNPDIKREYEVTQHHRDFSKYVHDLRRQPCVLDLYTSALKDKMDSFYNNLPERAKWDIPNVDFFYNCGAAMMKFGALPVNFSIASLEPELSDIKLRRAESLAKFKEQQTGVKQW